MKAVSLAAKLLKKRIRSRDLRMSRRSSHVSSARSCHLWLAIESSVRRGVAETRNIKSGMKNIWIYYFRDTYSTDDVLYDSEYLLAI